MIIEILMASIALWAIFIVFATVKEKYLQTKNMLFEGLLAIVSVPFFIVDIAYNITFGSLVFMQFPHWKRLTLTARLKYILYGSDSGWRYRLSSFVCRRLIEPWDYNHCSLANE